MGLKEIKELIVISLTIILVGSIFYSFVEGWRFLDAIYFAVVTVTTLGYGDFVPLTDAGKIFTIIYALSGIGIVFYFLAIIGKYIAFEIRKRDLRIQSIKRGVGFDISKFNINELIRWHPEKGTVLEGNIIGINMNYLKVKLIKKNSKILPKKEQKTVIITSKGKVKRV